MSSYEQRTTTRTAVIFKIKCKTISSILTGLPSQKAATSVEPLYKLLHIHQSLIKNYLLNLHLCSKDFFLCGFERYSRVSKTLSFSSKEKSHRSGFILIISIFNIDNQTLLRNNNHIWMLYCKRVFLIMTLHSSTRVASYLIEINRMSGKSWRVKIGASYELLPLH